MSDLRIPSLIAVPLWVGSTLAVLGYTYLAFKETASGSENGRAVNTELSSRQSEEELKGWLAQLPELKPMKPLERNRFKKSGEK